MEPLSLIVIFIIGFIAAFVGTNVGGGGLIIIPLLVFLGMPPKIAIATMRVGTLGLTGSIYEFHKSKKIDYKIAIPAAALSLIGAYIGSNVLIEMPDDIVSKLIGILTLVVLGVVVTNRSAGIKHITIKNKWLEPLGYLLFIFVGFWGGFFGGGTGIFASYVLIFMFGQTFLESAGTRKISIVAYSLISLAVFAANGMVEWTSGLVLLVGMFFGACAGASYAIKKGDKWVRALFVIVVIISAIKLLL